MATVEIPSAIPAEEMADTKEVCRLIAEGKRYRFRTAEAHLRAF